jgi:hypothetical protein
MESFTTIQVKERWRFQREPPDYIKLRPAKGLPRLAGKGNLPAGDLGPARGHVTKEECAVL